MRRQCITIVILALGLREVICRFTIEEGPFEALVHNVSNCMRVENPWFHVNLTTYTSNGRSLLRGSFVAERPMKNVKFTIQLHYIEQGKFKVFELKNINCQNLVMRVVLQALKVRYNAQKCTLNPSTTEFSNLDINAIIHTVAQSLWYGTAVVRYEIAIAKPAAQLTCLEISMDIIKADNKNGVKAG